MSNKTFNKKNRNPLFKVPNTIFKSSALISIALAGTSCGSKKQDPNVLYVFPDQFRNHALEFWGEEDFSSFVNFKNDPVFTPNLNKFARESVVLTSAQSNCPLSSPHRGMLLTGMYPDGSGVPLNCNSTRPISNLREDAIAISDIFSENGYDCGYIGKLHVDYPTKNNPQHQGMYVEDRTLVWDAYTPIERRHGFNYWYSYGTFNEHKSPHYWDTDGVRHEIQEWSPKHETDKAIEFLKDKRNKSKPFFLMVSMNPPHSPYQSLDDVMEEDYNLYKDTPIEDLLVRPNINPKLKEKQQCVPYYFASVTGVDREFGRILKTLEELGLDKNTIVVFTSDHGETMASHLEDPKNSPYTESMNVPFLIRYPKKLKPHVNDVLLSTPDIMPTLLSLAKLEKKIPNSVQGRNLSGYLKQDTNKKTAPQSVLYIRNIDGGKTEDGTVLNYFPIARGVKTERYTLSLTIDRNKQLKNILFFDDKNDPYQMQNLSTDEHKEVFTHLCKELSYLLKSADDPWYKESILNDIIQY